MSESKQLMPTTTSMVFDDTKVMPTYAQLRNLNLITYFGFRLAYSVHCSPVNDKAVVYHVL